MRTNSVIAFCIIALACADGPTVPQPSLLELRAAPTALSLDGADVMFDVFLWRDFMPIAPPDGRPLSIVVRQRGNGPLAGVPHIWVLNSDEVWSVAARRVDATQEWVGQQGPKWGPGIRVDVILLVRSPAGTQGLLRVPGAPIWRTD